jgi:hypothetical protein
MNVFEHADEVTVSDLVAAGMDRHKARHTLEAMAAKGEAVKVTKGRKVSYRRLGENETAVLAALRDRKALSASVVSRRANLPVPTVVEVLAVLAAVGLARQPFRSRRFVRA